VDNFDYGAGKRLLSTGELLCVVTDGVVDAQNPAGKRYGSDRLRAVLLRLQGDQATAGAAVDAVRADLRSFVDTAEPADDVTVLALRWMGSELRR
jgi:serine phosphatase RsbU (regulator of sigma subunit)